MLASRWLMLDRAAYAMRACVYGLSKKWGDLG